MRFFLHGFVFCVAIVCAHNNCIMYSRHALRQVRVDIYFYMQQLEGGSTCSHSQPGHPSGIPRTTMIQYIPGILMVDGDAICYEVCMEKCPVFRYRNLGFCPHDGGGNGLVCFSLACDDFVPPCYDLGRSCQIACNSWLS